MSLPAVVINGDQFRIMSQPSDPRMEDKKILGDELAPIVTKLWEQMHQAEKTPGLEKFTSGRTLMYVVTDPVQAAACFCDAANLGLPEGLFTFARCCLEGVGVQQNKEAAERAFIALSEKCTAIVGENTERQPIERIWAIYLHSLCFYYYMKKPAALRLFHTVVWDIQKMFIEAPQNSIETPLIEAVTKIQTAADAWSTRIQNEIGKKE
jgi:hypothetical protein